MVEGLYDPRDDDLVIGIVRKKPYGLREMFLEQRQGHGLEVSHRLVEQEKAHANGQGCQLIVFEVEHLARDAEVPREGCELRVVRREDPAARNDTLDTLTGWALTRTLQNKTNENNQEGEGESENPATESYTDSPRPPALETSAARVPLEAPNIGALTMTGFWVCGNHAFSRLLSFTSFLEWAILLRCSMADACLLSCSCFLGLDLYGRGKERYWRVSC